MITMKSVEKEEDIVVLNRISNLATQKNQTTLRSWIISLFAGTFMSAKGLFFLLMYFVLLTFCFFAVLIPMIIVAAGHNLAMNAVSTTMEMLAFIITFLFFLYIFCMIVNCSIVGISGLLIHNIELESTPLKRLGENHLERIDFGLEIFKIVVHVIRSLFHVCWPIFFNICCTCLCVLFFILWIVFSRVAFEHNDFAYQDDDIKYYDSLIILFLGLMMFTCVCCCCSYFFICLSVGCDLPENCSFWLLTLNKRSGKGVKRVIDSVGTTQDPKWSEEYNKTNEQNIERGMFEDAAETVFLANHLLTKEPERMNTISIFYFVLNNFIFYPIKTMFQLLCFSPPMFCCIWLCCCMLPIVSVMATILGLSWQFAFNIIPFVICLTILIAISCFYMHTFVWNFIERGLLGYKTFENYMFRKYPKLVPEKFLWLIKWATNIPTFFCCGFGCISKIGNGFMVPTSCCVALCLFNFFFNILVTLIAEWANVKDFGYYYVELSAVIFCINLSGCFLFITHFIINSCCCDIPDYINWGIVWYDKWAFLIDWLKDTPLVEVAEIPHEPGVKNPDDIDIEVDMADDDVEIKKQKKKTKPDDGSSSTSEEDDEDEAELTDVEIRRKPKKKKKDKDFDELLETMEKKGEGQQDDEHEFGEQPTRNVLFSRNKSEDEEDEEEDEEDEGQVDEEEGEDSDDVEVYDVEKKDESSSDEMEKMRI